MNYSELEGEREKPLVSFEEKPLISSFLLGQLVAANLIEEAMQKNPVQGEGVHDRASTIAKMLDHDASDHPSAAMAELDARLNHLKESLQTIEESGMFHDVILANKIKGHYQLPKVQYHLNKVEYLEGYHKQLQKYFEEEKHSVVAPSSKPVFSSSQLGQYVATAQAVEENVKELSLDAGKHTGAEEYFVEVLEYPFDGVRHIEENLLSYEKYFDTIPDQNMVYEFRLLTKVKGQYQILNEPLVGNEKEEFLLSYDKQLRKYAKKPEIAYKVLGQLVATLQLMEEAVGGLESVETEIQAHGPTLLGEMIINQRTGMKWFDHWIETLYQYFDELPEKQLVRNLTLLQKIRGQYSIPNAPIAEENEGEYLKAYEEQISKYKSGEKE